MFQVFGKVKDEEGMAWYPAKIKMLKGEFAVISSPLDANDILSLDRIRPVNHKYEPLFSFYFIKNLKMLF